MTFRISIALAMVVVVATVAPAEAKSKPKGKAASGVYCEQGGANGYFPISSFKPSLRSRLRAGQKAKINIAGFGPLNCRVY